MKQENIILTKTYEFSLAIVKLYSHLRGTQVERALCVQLLRSATSVGANTEEAMGGSSKRDFVYRLELAYREARESRYWLRLLADAGLIVKELAAGFHEKCEEIIRILTAIINTAKNKGKQTNY